MQVAFFSSRVAMQDLTPHLQFGQEIRLTKFIDESLGLTIVDEITKASGGRLRKNA